MATAAPGFNVLPPKATVTTVTTTFAAAPGGANRNMPQYSIPVGQAFSLRDCLLNKADLIRRRGGLTTVATVAASGRCIGLVRTQNPVGGEAMAALVNAGTDALTGFEGGSLAFTWPTALSHSPYSLFCGMDAAAGGAFVGTGTTYTTGRTLGFYYGSKLPVSSSLTLSAGGTVGAKTITVSSGAAGIDAGMFVFGDTASSGGSATVLMGVCKSVSGQVITLVDPCLAAAYAIVKGYPVRGVNPRVTAGTITTDSATTLVQGANTKFLSQGMVGGGAGVGWDIFTANMVYVGTVTSIAADDQLTLATNAAISMANDDYIAINTFSASTGAGYGTAITLDQLGFVTANFGGHQFYAQGNTLYFADAVDPEGVDLTPDGNSLIFSPDTIRALVPGLSELVSLSEDEAYALVGAIGTTPDRWRGDRIHDDGTICGMSALEYQGGAIWAGKRGIWFYDGTTPVNLVANLGDDYVNFAMNATHAYGMVLHNTYFCFIEDGQTGIFNEYRGSTNSDVSRITISVDLETGAVSWHRNLECRGWTPLPSSVSVGTVLFGVSTSTPAVKVMNGDSIFQDAGQDDSTCEGSTAGPSIYVESAMADIGDPQRLKLFKMLLLAYDALGGNIKLDTVVGLNTAGITATDQFLDSTGTGYQDKRVKFMKRGQVMAFRLYESDISGPTGGTAIGTCTITVATPGVITVTNTLVAGQQVIFATTGALPTGLVAGTRYFVIATGLTTGHFEVSATSGGSAINTTGTQSGVHTVSSFGVPNMTRVTFGAWALAYRVKRPGRV